MEERGRGADLPILIVEDDPAGAKLLAVVLADEGCPVRVAHTAEEALLILRSYRPRAILLDLVLPTMSGVMLAGLVRQDPVHHDVPIIAVTSLNGAMGERIALEAGCTAYVRKPVDALEFFPLLLTHLQEKKRA
ncbi:MAG: response regulator [Polyangia bacterium]